MPTEEAEKKIDELTQSYNGLDCYPVKAWRQLPWVDPHRLSINGAVREVLIKPHSENKKYSDRRSK